MSDNRQEQWLIARIQDVIRQGEKYPAFTAFLDEREAAIAEKMVRCARCENFRLWGGYENGERVMLGVFPSLSGNLTRKNSPSQPSPRDTGPVTN